MKNTLAIAQRQFLSYFNGPVAYIVSVIVLGFVAFMFWMQFFLAGRATVNEMFFWFGIAFVLAAPALTMGLIAEEKRSGTLEVLLTMPVKESEVILGKFLGAFGLFLVIIALSFANPIAVSTLGNLDWGPVFAGYLGLVLQGGAMLSVGIMASSLTKDQLVAFFISLFILAIAGWIAPLMLQYTATGMWATVLQNISLQSHLQSMTRGVVDTRDIVYFLSIITIGLLVSFRSLESRRWS
ncbi:MAG: ABC transporter permease [Sandaracinaceae bacterium]